MLFNSFEFVVFLPAMFLAYWLLSRFPAKAQNLLLWIGGYVFYGWWDWRFLLLLAISTVIDFIVAQQIHKNDSEKLRRIWLYVSLVSQLGMLAVFKYLNFFIDSWMVAWSSVGVDMKLHAINIILPVGISFYTFQTLSYVIDVYRGKIEPERNIVTFGAFITFFPQLMAGPIERAHRMLPQFRTQRRFDYPQAIEGLLLIIWGFFKKVAVADNLGVFVDRIWDSPSGFSSLTLFLAVVAFAFQIYGDFSGYSDIAIGVGKLFGFELMSNFKVPYLSRSISEFWKRWHISLSTWFQEYLFMPLAISMRNWRHFGVAIAVFITFLLSGIWHGANWTFVAWGAFHGIFLALEHLLRTGKPGILPEPHAAWSFRQAPLVLVTFGVVAFGLLLFRAPSLPKAGEFILLLFSTGQGATNYFPSTRVLAYLSIFLILDWTYRHNERLPLRRFGLPKWVHQTAILLLCLTVLRWIFSHEAAFIYFQF